MLAVEGHGPSARAQIDFGDQTMWLVLRHAPLDKALSRHRRARSGVLPAGPVGGTAQQATSMPRARRNGAGSIWFHICPWCTSKCRWRAGGVAGGALVADHLADADPVSDGDLHAALVGVVGQVAVAVVDEDRDAVAVADVAGLDDRAGGGGADRGAGRQGEVDAGVQGAPALPVVRR
ncbi:hypothetical protein TPA0907_02740 [Micromonospora humidisoli]|nr:hypothetical protein TPA0907_02740 [Micromonospora sp. AKA109]